MAADVGLTREELLDELGRLRLQVAELEAAAERKRAEEALVRLSNAVNMTTDSIVISDLQGIIVDVNQATLEMYGADDRGDLTGKSSLDLIAPEEREKAVAGTQEVLEKGYVRSREYRIITKDGGRVPVEMSVALLKDAEGEPTGFVAVSRDITERKRAEEALRESEERYRALFESKLDGVCVIDEAMTLLLANQAAADIFGFDSVQEMLEVNPFRFIPPEERERLLTTVQQDMFRDDKRELVEFRLMTKAGEEVWISAVGAVMEFQGKPAGLVSFRDITERKRAEEALRESEERYRTLFERVPVGLYRTTAEGEILDANPAMVEMFGYADRESLLAANARDLFVNPDRRRDELALLHRVGVVHNYEAQMRRRDGAAMWVEDTVRTVRDSEGKVVYHEGNLEDITERKRAEEALRQSEEIKALILDRMSELVVLQDDDHTLVLVNRAVAESVGVEPDELVGLRCYEVWQQRSEPCEGCPVALARETGEPREAQMTTPDGREWLVRGSPVLDESGNVVGLVEVALEVTERVELEERLRRAAKLEAVGQLAAGVAHQFNNLMTVVNGYSEFIMNRLAPHDPMREDVREIQRAGNRAARLTSQLLSFGRRQMLQMQVVSWNEVLEGMGGALESVVREDICLELKLASGLGKVKIDPGQMEQVLMGMVTNSCEAMPTGGVLVIETANAELDEAYAASHEGVEPGEYVMLAISDTGVGMTPEVQEHIFEPFFTTKGMALGTGLGLAAVYGMVKQIGGSIDVYSEPGQGTTFKIYLLRVDETQVREEPERLRIKIPGGTETILVMEDNEGVRRLAVNLLARLGYKVLGAASGAEALGLVRGGDERIDLVLTDVVMPDMSGSELVGRLCKERPGLKAVYMSGYPDEVIMYHGVRVPESRLMQKPFHIQEVAERLREVLEEG